MRLINQFSLVLVFSTLSLGLMGQQKMGHINSGNILEKLPAVVKSNRVITALQDSFKIEMDTKVARFRSKYEVALKAVNEGTLTPAQQKIKEDELNTEQAGLVSYQKEIEAFLNTKRQAMLTPIIDKLNKAVKEVGKENGYAYIFDQAVGNLLYAADSDDVTRLVEKKLSL